jgi:hypothetical protein
MNERPTPETDGIEFHAMAGMMPPYNTVPADFARRLERERDEARDFAQKITDKALSATGDLQRQLAEAREELEDWRNAAKGAENLHPDEHHCTCVPLLHKLLKEAREAFVIATDQLVQAQVEIRRLRSIEP